MAICRMCLRDRRELAYATQHVNICQPCIDGLNANPEPAQYAEQRIAGLLRTGMSKRNPQFAEAEYQRALPGWFNRLLAKQSNNSRDFIVVRAHRRGLVRADGSRPWNYPADWIERARRIRSRDQCCHDCGADNVPLDVHHIVYLSNYGTNRQENLVSVCRPCHEKIHGREFDFGEPEEPGNPNPIQPRTHHKRPASLQKSAPISPTLAPPPAPAVQPSVPPESHPWPTEATPAAIDLTCPRCNAELTASLTTAVLAVQSVRCTNCMLIFSASDGLDHRLKPYKPTPTPQVPLAGTFEPRPASLSPSMMGRVSNPQIAEIQHPIQRDITCPKCLAVLTVPRSAAERPTQRLRCKNCLTVFLPSGTVVEKAAIPDRQKGATPRYTQSSSVRHPIAWPLPHFAWAFVLLAGLLGLGLVAVAVNRSVPEPTISRAVMAPTSPKTQQQLVDDVANGIVVKYPYLNTKKGENDTGRIIQRRDALIGEGMAPADALRQAADEIASQHSPK